MMNNYSNFASRYNTQPSVYGGGGHREQQQYNAPHRQEQAIDQGFAFGANNFLGNQFSAGSNFSNPTNFFNGGGINQSAAQSGHIFNAGNNMNVNFSSAPQYEVSKHESRRYGKENCAPRQHKQALYEVPSHPMPQPPIVPQKPACDYPPIQPPVCPPPVVHPPAPPVAPPAPPVEPPAPPVVHPPAPPVQTNLVGLAGDPDVYDATGKKVTVQQNTGYHNLYANGEGFAGNAAGGQLAGLLNRQVALGDAQAVVKEANAQGLYQGGLPNGGIAVNSLVEQLNGQEPNKVANTQYGVSVGDYKVQLAGGLTQVIKPDGTTVTLKPDGSEFKIGDLATLRAGVTLPGSGEARTVLAYNEKLKQGGTSTDLLTWGFRTPDGLGATERASAGYADGVQRLDSNGNKNYYDFQVIQNAQANQVG